jgi:hypothetical protein
MQFHVWTKNSRAFVKNYLASLLPYTPPPQLKFYPRFVQNYYKKLKEIEKKSKYIYIPPPVVKDIVVVPESIRNQYWQVIQIKKYLHSFKSRLCLEFSPSYAIANPIIRSTPKPFMDKKYLFNFIHLQYRFWNTNSINFVKNHLKICTQYKITYQPWFVKAYYNRINRIKQQEEFVYKPIPKEKDITIIPE